MSYILSNSEIKELESLEAGQMIQRLATIRHALRDIILQQKKGSGNSRPQKTTSNSQR